MLAIRASDKSNIITHQNQDDIYKYGLEKFVDEAKMLRRFQTSPNLVTIYRVFQENNTAYFTMAYHPGMTLEEYVKQKSSQGGITEKELLYLMREVLNGLKALHNENIFLREIKPSKIYLPHKDKPFLLYFGNARLAIRDSSSFYEEFLIPSYAPKEQYEKTERQGAYTDIYACAATMYACMRGRFKKNILLPPPDSLDICLGQAKLEHLEKVSRQPVSREFNHAVHFALQCEHHNRPQSVAEWLSYLPFPPSYELLGIAGEYEGATITLNEEPIMLGKNPAKCNLVIQNHSLSRVSGVHCQVYVKNDRIYLEDFSLHGTTVNEHNEVVKQRKTELKPNDTLNLVGEAVFQIIQNEQKPLQPEPPHSITTTPTSFWQRFAAWFIEKKNRHDMIVNKEFKP
ncbi:hypothetical protein PN36_06235 [Candidatus Thiomargarita nelsonii]|uniref:FHA domain-containing protein n=1 Tax=Candidatus Thiomargarita nelsonii TaxID=1003181 RepID=A0A0A6RTX4_9GAMM|nr:hypothetical protein PN36_06235 [Candidatus Thiomargarita nelsonii]